VSSFQNVNDLNNNNTYERHSRNLCKWYTHIARKSWYTARIFCFNKSCNRNCSISTGTS